MSYHTWTTYGYGVCVDDIDTTPEKLLRLASMNKDVYKEVRDYLDEYFEGQGYIDQALTMDVFDELGGDYCERGVAYVLYQMIREIPVEFADDYNCTPYILYSPSYPWGRGKDEKNLTEDDVTNIFRKYISVLTDKPVPIDYYSVENGG